MKTVIITGANGNLGTAVTSAFLAKDYRVIATVFRDEERSDIPAHPNLHVEAVDLSREEEAEKFISRSLETYGPIDGAMLLVGGFTMGAVEQTTITDIRKQINLNFETAYHVVHPLYAHMKQNNKGRVVFIGARPALLPAAGKSMIAYGLSKSLLFKLAEYLNEDAKGSNVTFSVVVPSTIDTPQNRKSMPNADPGKWVKAESIAEVLGFIMSDHASVLRESVFKVYNNS